MSKWYCEFSASVHGVSEMCPPQWSPLQAVFKIICNNMEEVLNCNIIFVPLYIESYGWVTGDE
jgi:hypothetical protein